MARNDGRIEKGQRLSSAISAKAWNRAQQAADVVLGVQPEIVAPPVIGGYESFLKVRVQNASSFDFSQYEPVKLVGVTNPNPDYLSALTGTDLESAKTTLKSSPVFQAGQGVCANNSQIPTREMINAVAVTVEPITKGAVGWAAFSGIVPAKIDISADGGAYVSLSKQKTNQGSSPFPAYVLQSNPFAGYRILWCESDVKSGPQSQKLALVDLTHWYAQPLVLAKTTSTITQTGGTAKLVCTTPNTSSSSSVTDTSIEVSVSRSLSVDVASGSYVWLANAWTHYPTWSVEGGAQRWHMVGVESMDYTLNIIYSYLPTGQKYVSSIQGGVGFDSSAGAEVNTIYQYAVKSRASR